MTRIKYVGVKEDGETAFSDQTGIPRWRKGDSHEIANEQLAKRMLQHPDVFAVDTGATKAAKVAAPAPSPTPAPAPAPTGETTAAAGATLAPGQAVGSPAPATTTAADPLAGLDDKAVKAFAKEKGLVIPGINAQKGAKLREKVLAALAGKK